MAKTSFANLKLKVVEDVETIEINGQDVEVKKYLPISDKYDLIMITLQQALEDKVYNPLKMDMFFHLNLVYLYTNLSFTEKQKEDPNKLYDILQSNGIIDKVIDAIPKFEWETLWQMISLTKEEYTRWNQSAAGMVAEVIEELPKSAEMASSLLQNFNSEDYKEVIRFAQAGNADRPVPSVVK